jgi:hypothetical protein
MQIRSSPAFSMTSRHPLPQAEQAPGPASYEARDVGMSPPRAVFARAAKQTFANTNDVPGPGSYALRSKLGSGPKAVLLSRKLDITSPTLQPGPTSYTPQLLQERTCYSFGMKTQVLAGKEKGETPGPGAYSPGEQIRSPRAV